MWRMIRGVARWEVRRGKLDRQDVVLKDVRDIVQTAVLNADLKWITGEPLLRYAEAAFGLPIATSG